MRAVDGLLGAHLRQRGIGGEPLARLAAAIAVEHSGALSGVLLLDRGEGLEPALGLDRHLERLADPEWDRPLVARASASGRTEVAEGRVAAPIVVDATVRGCLYLVAAESQGEAVARLAGQVAYRIAALLESAELVEELGRRTRNMATLEALGALLAGGALSATHLERALVAAVESTGSERAALALFLQGSASTELKIHPAEAVEVAELAHRVAGDVTAGREPTALASLSGPHLFAALRPRLVPDAGDEAVEPPAGFLLVARSGADYAPADRSFFNALAHLLEGTLARIETFRRAAQDPLTATGTRLALNLALSDAEALVRQRGIEYSAVLVDVDRFKEINDSYGHPAGDAVLREVADLLRSRLRAHDSVARYGGDEFLLILPMTAIDDAARLARELRRLTARRRFTERKLSVSLSMGVAARGTGDDGPAEVIARADRALYRAKAEGRDRVSVDTGEPLSETGSGPLLR